MPKARHIPDDHWRAIKEAARLAIDQLDPIDVDIIDLKHSRTYLINLQATLVIKGRRNANSPS